MPVGTVHISARIMARKDKIEEVGAILRALVLPTRQEEGCISYRLMQDAARRHEFVTLEEWRNAGDAEAHMHTPHVQAAIANIVPLLDSAPDIRHYELLL